MAEPDRVRPPSIALPFVLQPIKDVTIVEFREASLMDPIVLANAAERLNKLVDEEDRRKLILDFEKVQFLSSQALGLVLALKGRIEKLSKGRLILCGVGPKLAELLKITRLDKALEIKPTQKEALAAFV